VNKGAIIGIVIAIAIIGVIASSLSFSENAPDVNDTTEEIIEEVTEESKPAGRSLSIELKESVGMKVIPTP